MIVRILIQTNK